MDRLKKTYSFGILPIRLNQDKHEVLLIQHHSGHWSFPKGQAEGNELPLETASRELKEETGLSILKLLSTLPFEERYDFYRKGVHIDKTVHYFPAIVEGEVVIQQLEIKSSQWLSLDDAQKRVTYEECRKVCHQLQAFLQN